MDIEIAKKMMDACRAKAGEVGKPVTVAIVDSGGFLMLLERMGGAGAGTAMTAESKAAASVVMNMDSGRVEEMWKNIPTVVESLAARLGGRFCARQGAVVINDKSGAVAGAIGASGALSSEDEDICRAGASLYNA